MPSPSMAVPMSRSTSMRKRSAPLGQAEAKAAPMQAQKFESSMEVSAAMDFEAMDDVDDRAQGADLGYDSFAAQRTEAPMEAPAPPPAADMLKEIAEHSKGRGRRVIQTKMNIQIHQRSPEELLGRHLSAAHDVFCLALLWIELLLGYPFFTGQTSQDVEDEISGWDTAKLPDEVLRWKPVLEKALAADPRDRYQSAAELAIAIVELAQTLGVKPAIPDCTASSLKPATFGPYLLDQTMQGGAGYDVRTATRNGAHRVVKIYDAAVSADDDFVDALFEEVRIDAPYILPLAEFGVEEGRAYLAYDGEARAALLSERLTEGAAFRAIVEASMAVEPLHASGGVHGSINDTEFVILENRSVALVGLGHKSGSVTQSVEIPAKVADWLSSTPKPFWK